jgi:hypothetical protein
VAKIVAPPPAPEEQAAHALGLDSINDGSVLLAIFTPADTNNTPEIQR